MKSEGKHGEGAGLTPEETAKAESERASTVKALQAKYPHLADQAHLAMRMDVTETTVTKARDAGGGIVAKDKIVVSRHRKYRFPGGQVVVLDE